MDRKEELLDIGAKMASKIGAANVTRRAVAVKAGVSDALVAHYLGSTAEAQKKYAARARKLGLTLPDKAKVESIGTKLRAHGPRDKRDTRKRSPREVEAIKRKVASVKVGKRVVHVSTRRSGMDARSSAVQKEIAKAIKAKAVLVPMPKAVLAEAAKRDKRVPPLLPAAKAIKGDAPENKARKLTPIAPPPGADVAS